MPRRRIMRLLLFLVVLAASATGCCCAPDTSCTTGNYPAFFAPSYAACREAYSPGYRRPCYPAYRPITSAFSP